MVAPFSARPHSRRGTPAAPGRALGPAYHAPAPAPRPDLITSDPAAALRAAIARAVDALRDLARQVEEREAAESEAAEHAETVIDDGGISGAGVLDFQIEMLLDEEILTPALARIARGEGPALAWAGAMGAYIDAFAAAGRGEDAFAARVADLMDLRQRVLDALTGQPAPGFPAGSVYVATDMAPSVFLAHDWSGGGAIALTGGSALGHVALLARSRGVPMVIGLGPLEVKDGQPLLVDADAGVLWLDPPTLPRGAPATAPPPTGGKDVPGPALLELAPGTVLRLNVNINTLADLDLFDPACVDGIGLVRTEFMFPTAAEALSEACHLAAYRQILARLGGRPVTIRMLDLGGDKVLPGVAQGGAASLLGQRGIRLLLAHTDLARIQVRALLRAAAFGPVSVLLPMVTTPEEVATMALLFAQEHARLVHAGVAARRPPLGMMVEVPAAALTLDLFEAAEFFSVGTNDLMQYLSAAARDNPAVASLNARSETALFRLLDQVHAAAHAVGKPVSVCGDLAGEPQWLARLIAAGFRDVSVAPGRLAPLRRQMAATEPRAAALAVPSLAADR